MAGEGRYGLNADAVYIRSGEAVLTLMEYMATLEGGGGGGTVTLAVRDLTGPDEAGELTVTYTDGTTSTIGTTPGQDGHTPVLAWEGTALSIDGVTGPDLLGPEGQRGPAGADGATGARGPEGPDGATGERGPEGDQGERGVQGPAGPAGMTWRGPWDEAVQYADTDAVNHLGSSWFAAGAPPLGEEPADVSTSWHVLSIHGAEGPRGPRGLEGPTGQRGPQGLPGESSVTEDTGWRSLNSAIGMSGVFPGWNNSEDLFAYRIRNGVIYWDLVVRRDIAAASWATVGITIDFRPLMQQGPGRSVFSMALRGADGTGAGTFYCRDSGTSLVRTSGALRDTYGAGGHSSYPLDRMPSFLPGRLIE